MRAISSLSEAITTTIRYFDQFDFPLTEIELTEYLYGFSATLDEIRKETARMSEICLVDRYYCLTGREAIIPLREEKNRHAAFLWKKVMRWRWLFALVPFVRMVAVCNTLSYDNVTPSSDIDLFVVAKEGRLGSARFFFKICTHIFGLRVHHEKVAGRFCLSFFITEDNLSLAPVAYQFDPHLAYFIKMMKPIYGVELYKKFIQSNSEWVSVYFKNEISFEASRLRTYNFLKPFQRFLEFMIGIAGISFESFLYNFQYQKDFKRMHRLPSLNKNVVLTPRMFKFHEQDSRREVAHQLSNFML